MQRGSIGVNRQYTHRGCENDAGLVPNPPISAAWVMGCRKPFGQVGEVTPLGLPVVPVVVRTWVATEFLQSKFGNSKVGSGGGQQLFILHPPGPGRFGGLYQRHRSAEWYCNGGQNRLNRLYIGRTRQFTAVRRCLFA